MCNGCQGTVRSAMAEEIIEVALVSIDSDNGAVRVYGQTADQEVIRVTSAALVRRDETTTPSDRAFVEHLARAGGR